MKRLAWASVVLFLFSCNKFVKPKQESLLDVVPQKAVAAFVVRADALKMMRQQIDDDPELQKELHEYLVKREGFDPSRVTAMAVFLTAPDLKEGAAFLRMTIDGTPKWQKSGDADGVAIYKLDENIFAATVPTGLILGTENGVRTAVATIQKKSPALDKTSPLKAMLEAGDDSQIILGASIEVSSDPQLKPVAALYGVEALTLGYSSTKIFAWADGQGAGLRAARDAAKGFIDMGLEKLKEEKTKALAGDDTLAGASTIIGYRTFSQLAPKVTPRMEGDHRLVVDYDLSKAPKFDTNAAMMTTVATVGVLAAVAIPAFMKYIRRSKTVEATMNLRKLFDSEVSYWESEHADNRGNILPKKFAPSADWTPPQSCCRFPEGKCPVDPSLWQGETWTALNFSIDDPSYYQYRVVQKDGGFIVEAKGDLNCNGVFSLFRRTGSITADGNVTGGPGLYSENDIE